MNQQSPRAPGRPVIQRAAYGGLYLGIYLSALALCSGMSLDVPLASLAVYAGTIGLPFAVYAILRRSLAETNFQGRFSEMLAEGIAVFLLGSAIQGVVIYLGLKYLSPDLISRTVDFTIQAFQQEGIAMTPEMQEAMEIMRRFTVTDVLAQIISTNLIGGMFMSLVLCSVLCLRYASAERRNRYIQKHSNKPSNGIG